MRKVTAIFAGFGVLTALAIVVARLAAQSDGKGLYDIERGIHLGEEIYAMYADDQGLWGAWIARRPSKGAPLVREAVFLNTEGRVTYRHALEWSAPVFNTQEYPSQRLFVQKGPDTPQKHTILVLGPRGVLGEIETKPYARFAVSNDSGVAAAFTGMPIVTMSLLLREPAGVAWYDLPLHETVGKYESADFSPRAGALSHGGKMLALVGHPRLEGGDYNQQFTRLYVLTPEGPLWDQPVGHGWPYRVLWSPDDSRILTGASSDRPVIYSRDGRQIRRMEGFWEALALAISHPKGTYLAAGRGRTVMLCKTDSGATVWTSMVPPKTIQDIYPNGIDVTDHGDVAVVTVKEPSRPWRADPKGMFLVSILGSGGRVLWQCSLPGAGFNDGLGIPVIRWTRDDQGLLVKARNTIYVIRRR